MKVVLSFGGILLAVLVASACKSRDYNSDISAASRTPTPQLKPAAMKNQLCRYTRSRWQSKDPQNTAGPQVKLTADTFYLFTGFDSVPQTPALSLLQILTTEGVSGEKRLVVSRPLEGVEGSVLRNGQDSTLITRFKFVLNPDSTKNIQYFDASLNAQDVVASGEVPKEWVLALSFRDNSSTDWKRINDGEPVRCEPSDLTVMPKDYVPKTPAESN
jgi:hypothetical protein